jgi:hypothetical protein
VQSSITVNPAVALTRRGGSFRMRVFFAAAIIASLAVGPAYAQGIKGGAPPPAPKSRQEIEAERAAERAYKNSLKNIPDQPAADPWGIARGVDSPKAATKDPAKRTPTGGTSN